MPAPAMTQVRYFSAKVGLCSTYSIFTRSGPQTKTASVFGASTTSATSMPAPLRVLERLLGRVDEHREVVEQRPLGIAGLAGVELDVRAADLDARRRPSGAKPNRAYVAAVASGLCREQRDVVEVVLDVGLAPRRARAEGPRRRRSRRRRSRGRRRCRRAPERRLEVVDAQRDVLERAPLARPLRVEERQLAAPRVGADEREAVRALDDVHAERCS